MIYKIFLLAGIVLAFGTSYLAHKRIDIPNRPETTPRWDCRRIVSMGPGITQTLYALGLGNPAVDPANQEIGGPGDRQIDGRGNANLPIGDRKRVGAANQEIGGPGGPMGNQGRGNPAADRVNQEIGGPDDPGDQVRVVGVTRSCRVPRGTAPVAVIGGQYDPDYEFILALKPDLVVLSEEQDQALPGFRKLNLETRVVSLKTVDDVLASFRSLGRIIGRGAEGRRLAGDYERRLQRIQNAVANRPRPKAAIVVQREPSSDRLAEMYVAANDGYFSRIIELAGGENAYREEGVRFSVLSPEGILKLGPKVILTLALSENMDNRGGRGVLFAWRDAAKGAGTPCPRGLVFDQDYYGAPGSQFIDIVEGLAAALHPEWYRNEGAGGRGKNNL